MAGSYDAGFNLLPVIGFSVLILFDYDKRVTSLKDHACLGVVPFFLCFNLLLCFLALSEYDPDYDSCKNKNCKNDQNDNNR